jgi:hypothetical protein
LFGDYLSANLFYSARRPAACRSVAVLGGLSMADFASYLAAIFGLVSVIGLVVINQRISDLQRRSGK